MGWKVPVSQGNGEFEDRENRPPGEYPAVLVALIDLGHQQKKEYEGNAMVWRHMIAVVWEVQGPETSEGEPFYFAEEFTFALGASANFVKKVLNKGGIVVPDAGDCDISEVLGRPYLLTVEEAQGKKKTYTRLAKDGIAKLPQVMHSSITEPVRPAFCWQLEDGVIPHHSWLPRLYGRTITQVMEGAQEFGPDQPGDAAEEGEEVPAGGGYEPAVDPNHIPF